jgi:hypothetical protein
MNDAFFTDPAVTEALDPIVLEYLKEVRPPADTDPAFQIGHWIAVAACAMTELRDHINGTIQEGN